MLGQAMLYPAHRCITAIFHQGHLEVQKEVLETFKTVQSQMEEW